MRAMEFRSHHSIFWSRGQSHSLCAVCFFLRFLLALPFFSCLGIGNGSNFGILAKHAEGDLPYACIC